MERTAITDTGKNIMWSQRTYIEDKDRTIAKFLLFGHKTEATIYRNRDVAGNIGATSYIKNIELRRNEMKLQLEEL